MRFPSAFPRIVGLAFSSEAFSSQAFSWAAFVKPEIGDGHAAELPLCSLD
jgi:hypothetical protein